ncbi:MAG: NADH-quinone oxidoreductase subunit NuoK [Deltaproteobacteria bacterium]|nr:NADH-quinone oxidoreductase subunit NuoK [Deltaproteobacteria bacterium]
MTLGHYLALASVLFTTGAVGFLVRRNALVALMSIELMLNAVNLTLVAANRWQPSMVPAGAEPATPEALAAAAGYASQSAIAHHGQVFAFFVIAVAAAEAAVGLAIVLAFYRLRKTIRTDAADTLKG